MVRFYAVLGCSNRSDQGNQLSYYRLLLKNKAVLKQWIHNIRRIVHECALIILLTLEPECFVQMKYWLQNFLSLQQRFLWYLNVQPSFDVRHLLGNDLEVLLRFGKKTPAWTPSFLEWILNCLRTSFMKQREATRVGRRMCRYERKTVFLLSQEY